MYDRVRDAECARVLACETPRDYDALARFACSRLTRDYERGAITSGTAHVDMDAARECLAGIASLGDCVVHSSTYPPDLPSRPFEAACLRYFVGEAPRCGAGTCPADSRCVPQADCAFTCEALPRDGEPCTNACASGSWCLSGVCQPDPRECRGGFDATWPEGSFCYLRLGSACTPPGVGLCVPGAHCSRASATCVSSPALLALGAACDPSSDPPCAAPLICDPTTRTCTRDPAVCDCPTGSYCTSTGTCISSPEGASCNTRSLDVGVVDDCAPGFLCGPDATCHVPGAVSGPCDPTTTACPPGTACASGRCAQLVADGGACDDARPCVPGLHCIAGVCAEAAPAIGTPGAPCRVDGTCSYGACIAGACAWLPDGSACLSGHDCQNCVAGVCQPRTVLVRGAVCSPFGVSPGVCAPSLACTFGWPGPTAAYCCPAP